MKTHKTNEPTSKNTISAFRSSGQLHTC